MTEANEDETKRMYDALLKALEEAKKQGTDSVSQNKETRPALIDYSKFRNEGQESYRTLYRADLNFAQNLQHIVDTLVPIPNKKIQLPILISALMAHTPICNVLPIIFCFGSAGSGKSTIAKIASPLYGVDMLNAGSTFASIRNVCNEMRWTYPEECEGERAYMLIWDDVKSPMLLENPNLYALFRGGYDRKTDKISIAGEAGKNIVFRVFGGRLLSSIEPIFNHPKMSELQRRTLPIVFKKFQDLTVSEKQRDLIPDDYTIADKPEFEDFNWDDLNEDYNAFWDESRMLEFGAIKNRFSRSPALKRKLSAPFALCKDIICTGVACGLFESLETAIVCFSNYWDNIASLQFADLSPIARILSDLIEATIAPNLEYNKKMEMDILPIEIDPKLVQDRVNTAQRNGELDMFPTPATTALVMAQLGWKNGKGSTGKTAWIPLHTT